MNTVCIVICKHIKAKIMYQIELNNAVSLFCEGFDKCFEDEIDYTISLYIEEKTTNKKGGALFRLLKNNQFECFLCNSKAIYDKNKKESAIYISSIDLLGSSGKYNYNMIFFLLTEVMTRILLEHGFCAYHASSISLKGKGVIFIGESMSGKTTLSLLLARKGYHYLGDDRVFIKNRKVYSYPKPIHISHDVRNFFEKGYLKKNELGKSFVSYNKYIPHQYQADNAEILGFFMFRRDAEKIENTFVKENRGTIYGLNSLFYCNEELSQLLDSIIELDEMPVYVFKNHYCEEQVREIDLMIKEMI